MSFNRAQFLIEVLGPDGALALAKAAARSEYLAQMVVPRTILAWLEANPEFEGVVPGADFAIKFTKSEDGFSGNLGDYQFQQATIFHVAGALASVMELDSLSFGNARNAELTRLGKSIDLMAKVHLVSQLSKREILGREESSPGDVGGEHSRQEIYQNDEHSKGEIHKDEKPASTKCPECGGTKSRHYDRLVAGIVLKCKNDKSKQLEKKATSMAGGTGKTAGPVAPAAPAAPTASAPQHTTPQQPKQAPGSAKPPKPAMGGNTMKLTRSESNARCTVCSQPQFHRGSFVGCMCFRALAKSVTVIGHDHDHVEIRLGDGWDRETTLTLLEAFGRR